MNGEKIKLKQERKNKQLIRTRISFTDQIRAKIVDRIILTVAKGEMKGDLDYRRHELLMDTIKDAQKVGYYDLDVMINRLYEAMDEVNRDTGAEIKIEPKDLDEDFRHMLITETVKGQNFSQRIWKHNMRLSEELVDIIDDYITLKDRSKAAISKDVARRFEVDNYTASRLINNEVARVESKTRLETFKRSGVIEEVEFVSMEDERVTDICQSLHGTIYNVNDPNIPRIPEDTHVGCRSFYRARIRKMDNYKFY